MCLCGRTHVSPRGPAWRIRPREFPQSHARGASRFGGDPYSANCYPQACHATRSNPRVRRRAGTNAPVHRHRRRSIAVRLNRFSPAFPAFSLRARNATPSRNRHGHSSTGCGYPCGVRASGRPYANPSRSGSTRAPHGDPDGRKRSRRAGRGSRLASRIRIAPASHDSEGERRGTRPFATRGDRR